MENRLGRTCPAATGRLLLAALGRSCVRSAITADLLGSADTPLLEMETDAPSLDADTWMGTGLVSRGSGGPQPRRG